jgi:hypothetical protein
MHPHLRFVEGRRFLETAFAQAKCDAVGHLHSDIQSAGWRIVNEASELAVTRTDRCIVEACLGQAQMTIRPSPDHIGVDIGLSIILPVANGTHLKGTLLC